MEPSIRQGIRHEISPDSKHPQQRQQFRHTVGYFERDLGKSLHIHGSDPRMSITYMRSFDVELDFT